MAEASGSTAGGLVQVLLPRALSSRFKEWLNQQGMYMYFIPVTDDLPTYGIGVRDDGAPRA